MEKHPRPQLGTGGDVVSQRIGAFIIDLILVTVLSWITIFLVTIVGEFALGGSSGTGAGAVTLLPLLFSFLAFLAPVAYFVVMEGVYGYTLGKQLLNLVVVNDDGTPVTMGGSLIRNLLRIVDYLPFWFVLGIVLIAATDRNQRLGDMAAGTVVVQTAAAATQYQQQGYQQGYQQGQQGYQQGHQQGYQQGYNQSQQGQRGRRGYDQSQQGQQGQRGYDQSRGDDKRYDQVDPRHLDEEDSSADDRLFGESDGDSGGGFGGDGGGGGSGGGE